VQGPEIRQTTTDPVDDVARAIAERYPVHPFSVGIHRENFEAVIAEYLAMSIAFPFLQAGAIHACYAAALRVKGDTDKNAEIVGAIGAFLVWDEMGGHELTLAHGERGLLRLPQTRLNFHSNLLRSDIRAVLGHDVATRRRAATARRK